MNEKIDKFIMNNIGQYWDSSEDLAKTLKEEFGDIFNDDEWLSIAINGINEAYT
jgi:hypothetical protein